MTQERIEAAAKAFEHALPYLTYHKAAEEALTAADEVMFSDEAVESAAKNSWNMLGIRDGGRPWDELTEPLQQMWTANVRIVAAALRGDRP